MSSFLEAATWLRPRPPTPIRPTLSLPFGDLDCVIAGKPKTAEETAVVLMNFRRENWEDTGWSFMAFIFQQVLLLYREKKFHGFAGNWEGILIGICSDYSFFVEIIPITKRLQNN